MKFLPCSRGCESPCNRGMGRIACVFIHGGLTGERGFVWYPPVQTLSSQDTQFDFGHIQPTAVLGCVMPFELFQNAPRFCGGKGCIERGGFVRVQVVHHETNHLGFWIADIDQPAHLLGKVQHRPLRSDGNMPPARLRFTEHKEVARPVALVFIVIARWRAGFGGQRHTCLRNQLLAGFIKVDLRARGIIGLLVEVEHVLHGGDKLGAHVWQAPLLFLPGLKFVFLSTCRTVSRAIDGAKPNSTTLSAKSRRVQCACPSGAGVHATAIKCASCLPVSFRRAPGRGASSSAPRFVSTNRWRVRATVAVPTSNVAAIALSLSPSAALSRMRARVSLRARVLPPRSRCSKVARSSALKSTTYFFLGMSGDSSHGRYPDCTLGLRIDQIHTDGVLGPSRA